MNRVLGWRAGVIMAVLLLAALPSGSLAQPKEKRQFFEGPPDARVRFLQGKKWPLICRTADSPPPDAPERAPDDDGDAEDLQPKVPEEPERTIWHDDPELLDASTIVDAIYDNVRDDVILTRGNFLSAWAKKLPLHIYKWERGALPPTRKAAFGGRSRYDSCALVGSSGHIGKTSYGHIIDQFDAVARANQSPTKGYEKHVGKKTTFRFVNEALGRDYRNSARKVVGTAAGVCNKIASAANGTEGVSWDDDFGVNVTGKISRVRNTGKVLRLCKLGIKEVIRRQLLSSNFVQFGKWPYALEKDAALVQVSEQKSVPKSFMLLEHNIKLLRPDTRVLMMSNIATHHIYHGMESWAERMVCKKFVKKKGGNRPTTGFQMLMMMMKVCNRVVLYGFGPSVGGQGNSSYHFFSGHNSKTWKTSSSSVHNFRAEFLFFKSLQSKGLLTICNDGSDADCGMSDIKVGKEMAKETANTVNQVPKLLAQLQQGTRTSTRRALPGRKAGAGGLLPMRTRHRISSRIRAPATSVRRPPPQAAKSSAFTGMKATLGSFLSSMEATLGQVAGLEFADEGPAGERQAEEEENDVGDDNF